MAQARDKTAEATNERSHSIAVVESAELGCIERRLAAVEDKVDILQRSLAAINAAIAEAQANVADRHRTVNDHR